MIGQGIRVIDRGWNAIARKLLALSDGRVASVGVQGEQALADHDGLTNAELAAIHEYGTQDGTIPERSFLRSTEADEEDWISGELAKIAKEKVFKGKDPEGSILLMGEGFKAKVIKKIKAGLEPPLADSTVAARGGSDTPLWDTGQLVNALSAEVVDPREKRAS